MERIRGKVVQYRASVNLDRIFEDLMLPGSCIDGGRDSFDDRRVPIWFRSGGQLPRFQLDC